MNIEKLHITPRAKQTLTYFEVETACKRHRLGRRNLSAFRSTRAGKFIVVSGDDAKTVNVLLECEHHSGGHDLALKALFGDRG